VAFSPDGTRILTVAGDRFKPGEAKVWDARSGAQLKGQPIHPTIANNLPSFVPGIMVAGPTAVAHKAVWRRSPPGGWKRERQRTRSDCGKDRSGDGGGQGVASVRQGPGTKVDPFRYALAALSDSASGPPVSAFSPAPAAAPSPPAAVADSSPGRATAEPPPTVTPAALIAAGAPSCTSPDPEIVDAPPAGLPLSDTVCAREQPQRSPEESELHAPVEPALAPNCPPAAPQPGPTAIVPDLPPHARWLLGYMPPRPEQREERMK